MTDTNIVRYMDFSPSVEPVTFRVAPDTFECVSEIALDSLLELADINTNSGDRKAQFERMKDFFDGIMTPDSAATFRQRMRKPTQEEPNPNPIGMQTVLKLLPWLMEVYGLRPTQQASESEDGSPPTDGSSTDSSSPEE